MTFRAIALALLLLLTAFAGLADAVGPVPWAKQAFVEAQQDGEPIVVFVHASW